MARMPNQPVPSNSCTHQSIAEDIAAFRKGGGRIEVLGDTPLRTNAPTAFRSANQSQRKAPTKVDG